VKIEVLRKEHIRDGFECGKPSLDRFLKQQARQHDERHLGRTFVLVEDDSLTVLGYYTLATGKVGFENLPDTKKLPPHIPIPVILLGRLAVDSRQKGRHLGELLLMHALWRAQQVGKQVGVYAVEVDALDEEARGFYLKYGFTSLQDDPLHLYLPIKTIEALNLDFEVTAE
jgi:GNAT superfamily N-acetyltransferase